jgi:hypothetical protein
MATNPAYRLHDILCELFDDKKIPNGFNVSKALCRVFGLAESDAIAHLECLSELNGLVIDIDKSLQKTGVKISSHTRALAASFGSRIAKLHPAMTITDARSALGGSVESLSGLQTCGHIIEAAGQDELEGSGDALAKLLELAESLEAILLDKSVSNEIKQSLLPIVLDLQKSIRLVRIKGSAAIIDIYHRAYGQTAAMASRYEEGDLEAKDVDKTAIKKWFEIADQLHKFAEATDKLKTISAPVIEQTAKLLSSIPW